MLCVLAALSACNLASKAKQAIDGNVTVPNVVGSTQASATTAITGANLTLGTVTMQSSASVASGIVISENPAAGASVAKLSAVALVVSSGAASVAVPNVVGSTQAAATTAITGAALTLGTVTVQASASVASGNVISENPAAGTSVASGSAVNLTVSSGPAMVAVPNVVGNTQTVATTTITGAGLTLGTVTMQSSLDDLLGHSITYRIAVGPRAGQKLFTLQTVAPRLQGPEGEPNGAARAGGFSLHAGVDIAPNERAKLERLCR